jgi:hypothetical protein
LQLISGAYTLSVIVVRSVGTFSGRRSSHYLSSFAMEPTLTDRLDSWKEIAAFLERDERTAMRWAKFLGMPVHHSPGGKHARVYAFRSELLAWMSHYSSDPASSERLSVHLSAIAPASGPATPATFSNNPSLSHSRVPTLWRSLFSRLWKHFTPYFPHTRHSKSDLLHRDSSHL